MKKNKKLWKILGGVIGIGAIACVIPACVVSCGSSSNTSTNTTQTQSSSASTNSYLNTNPNYTFNPNSTPNSNYANELATSTPFDFYLGGVDTPNTNINQSTDTITINLSLNHLQSNSAVLTSYSTTPTLIAIVPKENSSFMVADATQAIPFSPSHPLLIQTLRGAPLQIVSRTYPEQIGLRLSFTVDGKDNDFVFTVPSYLGGEYDFNNVLNQFTIDENGTDYQINLTADFTPYVVNMSAPLTASDFKNALSQPMTSNPEIEGATYIQGESYQSYYTTNYSILSQPTMTIDGESGPGGIPVPTPTVNHHDTWLPEGFPSMIYQNGIDEALYLYNGGFSLITYNGMTCQQWQTLIMDLLKPYAPTSK